MDITQVVRMHGRNPKALKSALKGKAFSLRIPCAESTEPSISTLNDLRQVVTEFPNAREVLGKRWGNLLLRLIDEDPRPHRYGRMVLSDQRSPSEDPKDIIFELPARGPLGLRDVIFDKPEELETTLFPPR